MKVGTQFRVSLIDMMRAHVGHLVEVPLPDEEERVLARIVSVDEGGATLKAVDPSTKD